MSIGTGIAIVGIWGAVALIGLHSPGAGIVVALFAMMATSEIGSNGNRKLK